MRTSTGTALAVPAADMDSLEARHTAGFDRFVALTGLPITLLALLIAPALVIEGHAKSAAVREAARAVNWIVWIAFCGQYVAKVTLSPDRRRFLRSGWVDL